MTINLHVPENVVLKPSITVFGVGGAGGNAVNNMIHSNLEGVKFVVANTDAQALEFSSAERRIQLGELLTRGLGAGAAPEVGKAAAEEAMNDVLEALEGSNMAFITAGMGGGTGTGAAPVIAKIAREKGILTVGVVTKPFHFEGSRRMRIAEQGLQELQKYVDTLIIIPNQNLFRIANEKTTFADAFKMADDVLHAGVRGVTDLMIMPGLINLDFADIRTVMSEMGKAMMGTGQAEGDKRALHAAEAAISNPLLDNVSMKGARGVLINITGGMDMTLFEVDEAANRIRDEVDPDANIIFGSTFNPELDGIIRVSVVATGIDSHLTQNYYDNNAHGGGRPAQQQEIKRQEEPAPAPIQVQPQQQEAQAQALASVQVTAPVQPQTSAPASVAPVSLQSSSMLRQPLAMENIHYPYDEEETDEDEAVFIPPRPAEPRSQSFMQPEYNQAPARPQAYAAAPAGSAAKPEADARVRAIKEPEKVEKEAPKSGFSLFGRMANSVRGRSNTPQPQATQTEPEDFGRAGYRQEENEIEASSGFREDVLDIPAFLRRKSPN